VIAAGSTGEGGVPTSRSEALGSPGSERESRSDALERPLGLSAGETPLSPTAELRFVQLQLSDRVGELTLRREDKLNALTEEMVAEIRSALRSAAQAEVRSLIICGAGRGFCAGRDLAGASPGDEDAAAILIEIFNPLILEIARFPAPTFAAVQGAALGVGLGIALACDIVYVADDARIGSPFAKIGAVLDSGAHLHLLRLIGAKRTLELIYTGRILTGIEAAEWGIANRSIAATELLSSVRALAHSVAGGPTQAFRESKRLLGRIDDEAMDLEALLHAEAIAQGVASRTQDYLEGITAFQERRQPHFSGS